MRQLSLLLIFVKLASSVDKTHPGHPRTTDERTPQQQVQEDLEALSGDMFNRIREYEALAPKMARALSDNTKIYTDDVAISVRVFNLSTSNKLDSRLQDLQDVWAQSNSCIHVPLKKIRGLARHQTAEELTVVSAWWKNAGNLTSNSNLLLPQNGTILSVSYFYDVGRVAEKVSLPVDYYVDLSHDFTELNSLKSNVRLSGIDRVCAWLDPVTESWNRTGCKATFDARGVNCECEHTTTFVTLLVVSTEIELSDEVHAVAMAFEIASICCLLATIVFILIARQGAGIDSTFAPKITGMNANRTNSQISLCLSLLCMHFVIVWSDFARNHNDKGCVAVTVFTHYFLLASAFWSFCEGVGIFIKVCPLVTMKVQYRTMTIAQSVVAWIIPLTITISTAFYGIQHGVYMDEALTYTMVQNKTSGVANASIKTPQYERCWLSRKNNTIWTAVGPVIFVVAVNIAILFYVTAGVVKMNKSHPVREMEFSETQYGCSSGNSARDTQTPPREVLPQRVASVQMSSALAHRRRVKHMTSVTRSFAILTPILGIPWILSIFANVAPVGVVLSSAHAVVNGLQGLQIFLLYCVVNKRDWRIVKRKWRNSDFRHLFSKYRYNRRDSVATNATRAVAYETRSNSVRVDSNGNAYLTVGWKSGGGTSPCDTLSSCRSSSGTINSTQSLQKNHKSLTKLSLWQWWRR